MTISKAHGTVAKRDAAHRRVRRVSLAVAAAVVGGTSYGAVALAQSTAVNGSSSSTVSPQGTSGGHVSAGTGQAPVASTGGS